MRVDIADGLFQWGDFALHSGRRSPFKINCDALTDSDIEALAKLVAPHLQFREVIGIPRGGLRLAEALKPYQQDFAWFPTLLVDDVLTTGKSMQQARAELIPNAYGVPSRGLVIFARRACPAWITPLFRLHANFAGGLDG